MNQATSSQPDPEMLDEYDFSEGIRGKYAERYHAGANPIRLDDDVASSELKCASNRRGEVPSPEL